MLVFAGSSSLVPRRLVVITGLKFGARTFYCIPCAYLHKCCCWRVLLFNLWDLYMTKKDLIGRIYIYIFVSWCHNYICDTIQNDLNRIRIIAKPCGVEKLYHNKYAKDIQNVSLCGYFNQKLIQIWSIFFNTYLYKDKLMKCEV